MRETQDPVVQCLILSIDPVAEQRIHLAIQGVAIEMPPVDGVQSLQREWEVLIFFFAHMLAIRLDTCADKRFKPVPLHFDPMLQIVQRGGKLPCQRRQLLVFGHDGLGLTSGCRITFLEALEDQILTWMVPQLGKCQHVVHYPGQDLKIGSVRFATVVHLLLEHVEQSRHVAVVSKELLNSQWKFV